MSEGVYYELKKIVDLKENPITLNRQQTNCHSLVYNLAYILTGGKDNSLEPPIVDNSIIVKLKDLFAGWSYMQINVDQISVLLILENI